MIDYLLLIKVYALQEDFAKNRYILKRLQLYVVCMLMIMLLEKCKEMKTKQMRSYQ